MGRAQRRSYLGDARVGALDVPTGPVEPGLGGRGAAVGPQRALGLPAAPPALELGVGFEAEPAALTLRRTLVQVHCGERGRHAMSCFSPRGGFLGFSLGVSSSSPPAVVQEMLLPNVGSPRTTRSLPPSQPSWCHDEPKHRYLSGPRGCR